MDPWSIRTRTNPSKPHPSPNESDARRVRPGSAATGRTETPRPAAPPSVGVGRGRHRSAPGHTGTVWCDGVPRVSAKPRITPAPDPQEHASSGIVSRAGRPVIEALRQSIDVFRIEVLRRRVEIFRAGGRDVRAEAPEIKPIQKQGAEQSHAFKERRAAPAIGGQGRFFRAGCDLDIFDIFIFIIFQYMVQTAGLRRQVTMSQGSPQRHKDRHKEDEKTGRISARDPVFTLPFVSSFVPFVPLW
jgi:hypothetical protein